MVRLVAYRAACSALSCRLPTWIPWSALYGSETSFSRASIGAWMLAFDEDEEPILTSAARRENPHRPVASGDGRSGLERALFPETCVFNIRFLHSLCARRGEFCFLFSVRSTHDSTLLYTLFPCGPCSSYFTKYLAIRLFFTLSVLRYNVFFEKLSRSVLPIFAPVQAIWNLHEL